MSALPPVRKVEGNAFGFLRSGEDVGEIRRTADVALRSHGLASNYNSLQTNIQKRFSGGLAFTAAYTWSKVLGTGDDQGGFIVQTDIRRNYGPTGFDRAHMFVASHIWELPFGKGKKYLSDGPGARILGGWQINGIFRAVTGAPFTVVADATPCNYPGNSNFADAVKNTTILGGVGRGRLWFDTTAFVAPGPNRYGNTGRNGVRGPGFVNYDPSVFRTFPVTEKWRLEFRAEFYNLTNTPRFGNPVNNVNAGNFGQILGAGGEREIQFALRLLF